VDSLPPSFEVRNYGDSLRDAVSRITAEGSQDVSRFLHSDLVILSSSPIKPRAAVPPPSLQNSPRPTYETDLEPESSELSNIPPELEKDSALFPLYLKLGMRQHITVTKTREERTLLAMREIERTGISMNRAARRYGLSRATLQDRISKGTSSRAEEGRRRQKLNVGETLVLRGYIDQMCDLGYPPTLPMIHNAAEAILRRRISTEQAISIRDPLLLKTKLGKH
jgi:helix-turn-helix, Psq domain